MEQYMLVEEITALIGAVNFATGGGIYRIVIYSDGSGSVTSSRNDAADRIFKFHKPFKELVYNAACEWLFEGMDAIERYVREDEPFVDRHWTIREITPGMFEVYALGSFKIVTFDNLGRDTNLAPESKVRLYIRQMLDMYRDPSRARKNTSTMRFDWIYLP